MQLYKVSQIIILTIFFVNLNGMGRGQKILTENTMLSIGNSMKQSLGRLVSTTKAPLGSEVPNSVKIVERLSKNLTVHPIDL